MTCDRSLASDTHAQSCASASRQRDRAKMGYTLNRSTTSRHRAAVNMGLLITLGVVALAAIGFWIWKLNSGEAGGPALDAMKYTLWCEKCKAEATYDSAGYKKVATQDGKPLCPKCQQPAQWGFPQKP